MSGLIRMAVETSTGWEVTKASQGAPGHSSHYPHLSPYFNLNFKNLILRYDHLVLGIVFTVASSYSKAETTLLSFLFAYREVKHSCVL